MISNFKLFEKIKNIEIDSTLSEDKINLIQDLFNGHMSRTSASKKVLYPVKINSTEKKSVIDKVVKLDVILNIKMNTEDIIIGSLSNTNEKITIEINNKKVFDFYTKDFDFEKFLLKIRDKYTDYLLNNKYIAKWN